jgi:hypothetical protein
MKNRGIRARQAVKQSANRARKLGKKCILYKPISPPLLLADSHLPFLHEGFLHGRSRLSRRPKFTPKNRCDAPTKDFISPIYLSKPANSRIPAQSPEIRRRRANQWRLSGPRIQ